MPVRNSLLFDPIDDAFLATFSKENLVELLAYKKDLLKGANLAGIDERPHIKILKTDIEKITERLSHLENRD